LHNILHRWVTILSDRGRFNVDPGRTLGEHPVKGGPIIANNGRFGPYVRHNRIYAWILAGKTPDTITMAEQLF
jgi:DNA topoisomerase I